MRQQPGFQRLHLRLGKTAQHRHHPVGQVGLQGRLEPRKQRGIEGLQDRTAQRTAPQVGEGVGQLAEAVEVVERAAAVDHQAHRRGELFFFLEAQRIGLVEMHQLAPRIEPGLRLRRVAHHLGKTRRPVRQGGAHPALCIARGVAAGQQAFDHALDLGWVKGRAALRADAGRGHQLRQAHHAAGCLHRAQRVVHARVVGRHVAIEGGDVADVGVGA